MNLKKSEVVLAYSFIVCLLRPIIIKFLIKPKLFAVTIMWLMVLVVLGTLAQKDMGLFAAQNKYISSWFIWFYFLPMPGGRFTLFIISINLSVRSDEDWILPRTASSNLIEVIK